MAVRSYQWNHDFSKLAREAGFTFDTRKSKVFINWNDIRVINIDRVIQERDFATIDEHLQEVLDCQLEKEFDVRILDSGFVKLFRLAQLSVEYLLQCRRHLDTAVPLLKAETKDMAEEVEHLKRQLRNKEEEIRRLRNKTRKQQKTMDYVKHSDISNIFKRMAMNDGQIPTSSTGEQAMKTFNKCLHCDKVFLNQFYLHLHVVRRHPDLPSFGGDGIERNTEKNSPGSSPEHTSRYKIETERLLQEIKELKDRVNATEKRLHTSELDNNVIGVEKGTIEMKSPSKANDNVTEKKEEQDKVEMDAMEKEMITKSTFEEWKKAEEEKFLEQIEALKKQLADSVKVIEEKEKLNLKVETEELQKMTDALKQQEMEVKTLKEQVEQKAKQDINELKTHLEAQEKMWKQKLQTSDEDHRRTIEELKSNMSSHLNESQELQKQYRERIDLLESNAKEQRKILEDQSRQLSVVGDSRKSPSSSKVTSPNRKMVNLEAQKKLRGESLETLPPYDEDSSQDSFVKPIYFTEKQNKNKASPVKNKTSIINYENDFENNSPGSFKSKKNRYKARKSKTPNETVALSSDSSPEKKSTSSVSRKLFDADLNKISKDTTSSVRSPPKNMVGNLRKRSASIIKVDGKIDEKRINSKMRKNKRDTNETDSEDSSGNILESGSEMSEEDSQDKSLSNLSNRQSLGHNVTNAVKGDLVMIVKKRLEQLGVDADSSGLPKEVYHKNMDAVHHRRELLSRKHKQYNKLQKKIMSVLEERAKEIKKKSQSSNREMSKSSSSLNKMGSIFSSVKNKAISMIRSRDNLKNERSKIEELLPKRKSRNEIIEDFFKKSPKQKSLSPKKKEIAADIHNSAMSILSSMQKTQTNKGNQNSQNMDVSLSASETASDSERSERIIEKNDAKQIVTTAISHLPSKSLENLLNSPVRKPIKVKDDDSSIAASTPTKKLENAQEIFGNISSIDNNEIMNFESKNVNINRISKSEENIQNMYAGASSSSEETDNDDHSRDIRKAVSEENVNKLQSQKSVLKTTLSSSSLSKKKVLFDLDSNQMKSLSVSPSVSAAIEVKAKANWEKRAGNNTDSDTEWDLSNDDPNSPDTTHMKSAEEIKLSTKQSPKIAEISKIIGKQLGARTEKPPVGGIDTIFQGNTITSSPKKGNIYGGSSTSIGSSVYDAHLEKDLMEASTSKNVSKQPIPKPRNVIQSKKKLDSDLELSDWSIDDIMNPK